MKQILYGVGKSLLRNYTKPSEVLAMSDLKNVTVEFVGEDEEITGGDGLYPIAYFPRSKAVNVSATNATFDIKMIELTQNSTTTVGETEMYEIFEYEIPKDLTVELEHTPDEDSLVVEGYKSTTLETEAGEYSLSDDTITFHEDDVGKLVKGFYTRKTSEKATTISGMKDGLNQTSTFIHRIPVYNDDNVIVGQAQLTVFKCKAGGNFEFNLAEKTAYAPVVTFNAMDPKRPDGKLWDFIVEPLD